MHFCRVISLRLADDALAVDFYTSYLLGRSTHTEYGSIPRRFCDQVKRLRFLSS